MIQTLLLKLIEIATAEVGYHEGSNNDNQYGIDYGWNNVAWCCIFAWWICNKAGVDFPKAAHCNQVESYAREHGRWVTGEYQVGDFVIFDYDLNGDRDHIGLIIEDKGSTYTTVEGNYSDAVCKVTRKPTDFIGAYRPDYGEEKEEIIYEDDIVTGTTCTVELPCLMIGDMGEAVEALQNLLDIHGYRPSNSRSIRGKFDGEFGNGTSTSVNKFQKSCGITDESGFVGPKTWKHLIGSLG